MKENRLINDALFAQKLNEIIAEIGGLPISERDKLMGAAKKMQRSRPVPKVNRESLSNSLDYLRVSIKYLLFDLEASRREIKHLRQLLEEKRRD